MMKPSVPFRIVLAVILFTAMLPRGEALPLDLPESMFFSDDGTHFIQGGVQSSGFYDETLLRTIALSFSQADYWQQMVNNYTAEVNIPADLAMDGKLYPSVGVRFKGMTSYNATGNSLKKSFNIETDYADSTQKLMGYKTLNLNNCYSDASFLREVLYFNTCRKYIPCPKANFVKLMINGENRGIYANVQQINADFIKEWFFSKNGDRWKAPMEMGNGNGVPKIAEPIPGGQQPGGQPGGQTPGGQNPGGQQGGIMIFNGGDRALTWLGSAVSLYQTKYELKSSGTSDPWGKLVTTCNVLNNTPLAQLADSLDAMLDIDRCLWFLAVENIFTDEDGYLTKGADYQFYTEAETGRINPIEYDGNESMKPNDVSLSPVYGETLTTRPLISRLLAVPELRQRYLAHVRTIIAESLDWNVLQPRVEAYRALIGEEVKADTLKLSTTAGYDSSLVELKKFVDSRRSYLLAFTEINRTSPEISSVSRKAMDGGDGSSLSGTAIRVTANVGGATAIGSVILHYGDGLAGAFADTLMYDDGLHGDGGAGDGVYGGIIPPRPVGMVRYYIEARASDAYNTASFSPAGAEHDVYVYKITAPVSDTTAIVINEVMAVNKTTIMDPQGDYEDWIELMNTGGGEIDLSGMYLSDDENDLLKWAIPEGTTLAPGGYLVLWADGDAGDTPGIHAGFKLSAGGEKVFLVDSVARGNAILDSVSYEKLETDISFGRYPDGSGTFMTMSAPTPGASNATRTGVSDDSLPESYRLEQNYPNPFNSSTVIGFTLPEAGEIDLTIFNLLGQKICTLEHGMYRAGTYQLHWNGRDDAGKEIASGVYLFRLQAGPYTNLHRLMLLR